MPLTKKADPQNQDPSKNSFHSATEKAVTLKISYSPNLTTFRLHLLFLYFFHLSHEKKEQFAPLTGGVFVASGTSGS